MLSIILSFSSSFSILWGIEGLEILLDPWQAVYPSRFQYPLGDRRFGNTSLVTSHKSPTTFQYPLGDRRFGNFIVWFSTTTAPVFQYPLGDRRFGNLGEHVFTEFINRFSILWGIEGLEILFEELVQDINSWFQYPLGDRRFGNLVGLSRNGP